MRSTTSTNFLLALAILFTISTAQYITTPLPAALPKCATPALLAAVQASGCQLTDALCICSNPKLLPSLMSAIETACDTADQAALVAFARTYCGTSIAASMTGRASITATAHMTSTPKSVVASTMGSSAPTRTLSVDTAALTTTSFTAGAITVTTSMTLAPGTTTSHNGTGTHITSATATQTQDGMIGAAAQQVGSSFLAFAIAVGAMGLVFAEF